MSARRWRSTTPTSHTPALCCCTSIDKLTGSCLLRLVNDCVCVCVCVCLCVSNQWWQALNFLTFLLSSSISIFNFYLLLAIKYVVKHIYIQVHTFMLEIKRSPKIRWPYKYACRIQRCLRTHTYAVTNTITKQQAKSAFRDRLA